MSKHKLNALLFVICSLAALPALGEKITNEQVLDTFDKYMTAMTTGKFETMAQYMHPGELETFKGYFVAIGESATQQGQFEDLGSFLGVETLDELKAMPGEKLFAKLFEVLTAIMPEFKNILNSAEVNLLGQVTEGEGEEELIHLVFRMEMKVNGAKVQTVDTAAMKKAEDGKYYFMVGEEAQGIINALRNQFGGVN